nr:MAG TPA: hypothetical protein [Caudoviricetes sp.]
MSLLTGILYSLSIISIFSATLSLSEKSADNKRCSS